MMFIFQALLLTVTIPFVEGRGKPVKATTAPQPTCATDTNSCGPNNPCANGLCCSQWGYCGLDAAYCGECCQNGACWDPSSTTSSSSTSSSTSTITTTSSTSAGSCAAATADCGTEKPCAEGFCCSQWGYCGTGDPYCGACCQSGLCYQSPSTTTTTSSTTSTTTTGTGTGATATLPSSSGDDSRLIAYLGNWQECPTDVQVESYTHIIIAFAVSYTWAPSQNNCDTTCSIASTVPVCNNVNNQALVDKWRGMGKKVLLSFGGAGMGGSWSGDTNNCWDYCFGREEKLSTDLVGIVQSQHFDGIDIDYEYCYDVAGLQGGRCSQRTSLYSDTKAQAFLSTLTSKLRIKLDGLGSGYELTHAPMDIDISRTDSKYYQILKTHNADLNFLLPQFYNGVTRPIADGVDGTGQGSMSATSIFSLLSNDMFPQKPNNVVFGFCISDCGGTGSNSNAAEAAQVMSELKTVNSGEFYCNGGAFFWVAQHDVNGAWSSTVSTEVSLTTGCSSSVVTTTGASTSSSSTTSASTTSSITTISTTTTTTSGTCGLADIYCTDNRQCCSNRCNRKTTRCK